MHFLRFFKEDWDEFKMACMWKGKKALKNPFLQNIHRDITVTTQCDKDGAKIKIKKS